MLVVELDESINALKSGLPPVPSTPTSALQTGAGPVVKPRLSCLGCGYDPLPPLRALPLGNEFGENAVNPRLATSDATRSCSLLTSSDEGELI